MLDPSQFAVNEAWIAFQLNEAPICTEADGDFNALALMDAASCYILGMELVPATSIHVSESVAERLLETGRSHKQEFPKTLFVPLDQLGGHLTTAAEIASIDVVRVPESQLLVFIAEARQGFKEHIGGDQTQ